MTVGIEMHGGYTVLVDDQDAPLVMAHRWHVKRKSTSNHLYAQRTIRLTPGRSGKKGSIQLHRFILDAKPGEVVDHINGNGLDNRRENLRLTTPRGNAMNVTSSKKQKRGGFKGVHWHKKGKKWEAYICAGEVKACGRRKRLYLGLFKSEAEAARAYDAAARKHFGEFAALNFPEGVASVAELELASDQEIAEHRARVSASAHLSGGVR